MNTYDFTTTRLVALGAAAAVLINVAIFAAVAALFIGA